MSRVVGGVVVSLFLVAAALGSGFPLDSAVNREQLKLSPASESMVRRNGFVVVPDSHEQLFLLYEDNWWNSIPSFVTTDLILQLQHLFLQSVLRRVEEDKLYFRLVEFTTRMADKLNAEQEDREFLRRAQAYFGVACRLLGVQVEVPDAVSADVEAELGLIGAHVGRRQSSVFPLALDYSQFVPRGHYTRSERLQRYFRTMMWYGLAPFPLEDSELGQDDIASLTLGAMVITRVMLESDSLVKLWQEIYEITSFFSGRSNDLTPLDYAEAMRQAGLLEDNEDWTYLLTPQRLVSFREEAKRRAGPRIQQVAVGLATGIQFRLMGQRYLPDSDIMQHLMDWPLRPLPKGLDVMAALGSGRARALLLEFYREQDSWPDYPRVLNSLQMEFAQLDSAAWSQSVYYAWLYALAALNDPVTEKHPAFVKNAAWQDKSLNTALGSWSELRHDVILYATPPYAEQGGPDFCKGYAEPNPKFYRRLERLASLLGRGLESRHLLDGSMPGLFEEYLGMVRSLATVSQKLLDGVPLAEEEDYFLWNLGEQVMDLSIRLVDETASYWYQIQGTDNFMACIADVANSLNKCLEVGVAAGNTIIALVPIDGRWTLARGAVFSYREFVWPASDRLTDEKWQDLVRSGEAPAPPAWSSSFTGH